MRALKLLVLCLFVFSINASVQGETADRARKIHIKNQQIPGGLKSAPIILSLEAYIYDSNEILLQELDGRSDVVNVYVINNTTGEVAFNGSVEIIEGSSSMIPLLDMSEGEFSITITNRSTIWEGTFAITD